MLVIVARARGRE